MQSSPLCDLFLTLYICLAARDQTGTGLYWQKCRYQAKGRDSSSNPSSTPQIMSAALSLPLGSPAQFHLMDKKRPRQPGWFSLKRRNKLEKSYWNLQVPICNTQRRERWVLLRGQEQMQLHGKFFLCCWEVFTLCGESGFSKERYRTTTRWNARSSNPGKHFSFTLHFDIHLHTSTHQWYQTNTPLLTQMKSSNTNRTSPAGREKCSTPHCKEFRSDALTCLDTGP